MAAAMAVSTIYPREVGVPHGPRVAWDGVRKKEAIMQHWRS